MCYKTSVFCNEMNADIHVSPREKRTIHPTRHFYLEILQEKKTKFFLIGSLDPTVFYYEFIFSEHTCEMKRKNKKNHIDYIIGRIYIRNLHVGIHHRQIKKRERKKTKKDFHLNVTR
jgi:hypothetical protein